MKIIVYSEIKWQWKTRKQHIITRLPKDWDILFLEPYKKDKKNSAYDENNIRIVTVPFLKNVKGTLKKLFAIKLFRDLFLIFSGVWIREVIRREGFHAADVVIISNLYAVPYLSFDCPVIYDMNDNHLAFENTPDWLLAWQIFLLEKATKIVVCSESLGDLLPDKSKMVYIGNGVDVSAFSEVMREVKERALSSQVFNPEKVID